MHNHLINLKKENNYQKPQYMKEGTQGSKAHDQKPKPRATHTLRVATTPSFPLPGRGWPPHPHIKCTTQKLANKSRLLGSRPISSSKVTYEFYKIIC